MADTPLEALLYSVARLRDIVGQLADADLTRPAYPRDWSIADVLSHLGSGAVIAQRRLDDGIAGKETPDDFAPSVWDTWNAKSPTGKRDDALVADAALAARLDAVTPDERGRFALAMGPMTVDFDGFVGLRLNEHAFHTWDIDVANDPEATIPIRLAELVVDNLELIARFTAQPTGDTQTIRISTTDPDRNFQIELSVDAVTFRRTNTTQRVDLQLPSEAFARLVYGRLDIDHTPPGHHEHALDVLRRVFPGP
jgi:uncharacterized protein (TIGR03083 family)